MSYRLSLVEGWVIREQDGASIPPNPENTDWQEYQAWLGLGNTPEPAVDHGSPDWFRSRVQAYASELGGWDAQLDMIYHDFDGWRQDVAGIKSRYPKPTESE